MAGGLAEEANIRKINLAKKIEDGEKIYIPYIGEDISDIIDEEIDISNANSKVNINTATQTELELLTGIGPSTALKIIQYRKANGKFKNIEEIKRRGNTNLQEYICMTGSLSCTVEIDRTL